MKKTSKVFALPGVLAVIILLITLLVPIYSPWDGLIPSGDSWTIGEVFEALGDDGLAAARMYGVRFPVISMSAALALLIGSLAKNRLLSIWSAVGGTGFMLWTLIRYLSDEDIAEVLNPNDGNISIGFWLIIGLFVIAFFVSSGIKKRSQHIQEQPSGTSPMPSSPTTKPIDLRHFGKGACIWMILCIIFAALSGILSFRANWLIALLFLLNAAMYILLFIKRIKESFFVISAVAVIGFIWNLAAGGSVIATVELLNPAITFMLIKKHWASLRKFTEVFNFNQTNASEEGLAKEIERSSFEDGNYLKRQK
jgi:hypothetical protein